MYFFRNYLFSLVFLYIFCTIVAYCFPFFLGVLYVLSSIFLLFSSISLFTYINYINLDFKKKHTYLYYLLFALYITLAATLFILLAKYAINHIDLWYIQMCKGSSGDNPSSSDNSSDNSGSNNNNGVLIIGVLTMGVLIMKGLNTIVVIMMKRIINKKKKSLFIQGQINV